MRVSVPFSNIISSGADFLFPLRAAGLNGVQDRLYRSNSGNHYFEFVYVREADIRASNLRMTYNTWEWLRQWRIEIHPYINLAGGTLSYRRFVAGKEVWYDILVPYRIEFETDPVDDQIVWDDVGQGNRWDNNFEVTDPATAALVRGLPIFANQ